MEECDVLIVGAGPVGAMAGLLLVKQGLKVILIEKEPAVAQSPRAILYLPQTSSTLEAAGLLEDVRNMGHVITGGLVWRSVPDFRPLATVDPSVLHPEDKPQGHFRAPTLLGQHKFAAIALKKYQEQGGQLHFDCAFQSLTEEGPKVHVTTVDAKGNERKITASFVLGTDGGHSGIRKAIGAHLDGFTHDMAMIAVNLKYPKIRDTGLGHAQVLVDPKENVEDTAHAVIIYTGTDDVWRCAYPDGSRFTEEELHERVPMRLKQILPLHPDENEYEVLQAQPYRIHQRCADFYTKGRIVLAGDAAHLNNPVGGMGLNTGLLDVHVASIAICEAMKMTDEAAIDKRLKEYGELRREAFLGYTNPTTTNNLRRAIEVSEEAEQKLRKEFFESFKDPEIQRQNLLAANKLALGVPGM